MTIAGMLSLWAGIPAYSAVIDFTYAEGEESRFGTRKTENYDVAMRLFDPGFVGDKVKGIKVPVCTEGISNVRLWLSKELKVETVGGKKVNVADIIELPATVEEGMASAVLDEPYTITDEGVYVGYSFDLDELTELTQYPVLTAYSTNPDGLYMHTERTYRKWVAFATDYQLCSLLTVTLETPDLENAAGISELPLTRAMTGEPFVQEVTIANHGTRPVSSVEYSYVVGGVSGTGDFVFDEPVAAVYNSKGTFEVTLPAVNEKGQVEISFDITKVNGEENLDPSAKARSYVNVLSVVPVHRAVMEEYTGTWCGYCVRGFAAMERLNTLYEDEFIALAYHNKDPMAITSSYPNSFPGFPYSYIDRAIGCDPYFGEPAYNFGIEKTWLDRCAVLAPASVDVKAEWNGDNCIDVTSSTTFIEVPAGSYAMAYYLVEDGMSGTSASWRQSNYYANGKEGPAESFIPEMEKFVEGIPSVGDLEFDDVVVMTSNMNGVPGSLDGIKYDEQFDHTYTFENIDGALNQYNDPVILDKSKLRAVVLLIDTATGEIVNAAKTGYIGSSSVGAIAEGNDIVATEYYDLCGRRATNPEKGIYIRVVRRSDGSAVSAKTVL